MPKGKDSNENRGFRKVSLDLLRVDEITSFDIYLKGPGESKYVLYRDRGLSFTEPAQRRLVEAGVVEVYVPDEQAGDLRRYFERNLGTILSDDQLEVAQKTEVLYTSLTGVVEDVMADPRSGDMVPRSQAIVAHTCAFLHEQEDALAHLLGVMSFDYYTYTHSVNVFVFSLSLAQRVLGNGKEIDEFGLGALLHDVGKSRIDPEIVNCKGKLTPQQFGVMKMHPVYGCEILEAKGGVGPLALDVVRHHHEKPSGDGYPDGLTADQISVHANIVKIADIFDALTTKRSYKSALDSFPALRLMMEEMVHELDADLFRTFVQMMGNQRGSGS